MHIRGVEVFSGQVCNLVTKFIVKSGDKFDLIIVKVVADGESRPTTLTAVRYFRGLYFIF